MEMNDALALLEHPALPEVLAAHPELAQELRALQEELQQLSTNFSQELAGEMRLAAAPESRAPMTELTAGNLARLQSSAAKRAAAAQQSRQTAEDLVFGTLANAGNPDWQPQEASTYHAPEQSLLLKILSTDLP